MFVSNLGLQIVSVSIGSVSFGRDMVALIYTRLWITFPMATFPMSCGVSGRAEKILSRTSTGVVSRTLNIRANSFEVSNDRAVPNSAERRSHDAFSVNTHFRQFRRRQEA